MKFQYGLWLVSAQICLSSSLNAGPISSISMPSTGTCPEGWRTGPRNAKVCCASGFTPNLQWPGNGKAACIADNTPIMTAPHKIPCPLRPKPPGTLETFCAAFMSGINLGGAKGKSPIAGNDTAINCADEGFSKIYEVERENYEHWVKCYGNLGCDGFTMQQQPLPPGCP